MYRNEKLKCLLKNRLQNSMRKLICANFKMCYIYFFLLSDNCNVNKDIFDIMHISNVGCFNHKLNLEVHQMVKTNSQLSNTIESVHTTMNSCMNILNNRATLRNLSELNLIMNNQTRQSGNFLVLNRFLCIIDKLIKVVHAEGKLFYIDGYAA